MRKKIQYALTCIVILACMIGLFAARGWNSTTALFPRVVGFPMLALAVIILVMEIRNRKHEKGLEEDAEVELETMAGRMFKYMGWLIGFVVLIWAIGLVYSIPIYIFAYMMFVGKYRWLKCGIYALATTAFVILIFGYVFGVAWPDGALVELLRS